MYVVRISDDPTRFAPGSKLLRDDGTELTVDASRPHRDRFLVKFAGVDTRSDAERLRGPLYVKASELRELGDDEYWEDDMIGLDVVDVDGNAVGKITGVVNNPAHDLLEVETTRGERLIPFVDAIVLEVNPETRRVTVDPPAGLLD